MAPEPAPEPDDYCAAHAGQSNCVDYEWSEPAAEEIDPNLNVSPDGSCTATPCGSNGQKPEMTCAELGLPEDQCGPDGRYTP